MEREHASETAEPTPVPAPLRAPGFTGILALQRMAGNRAVGALLARQTTVTTTTDPRLDYRAAGVPDTPGLDTQHLPYDDPDHPLQGWDGQAILNRLTQHDELSLTSTDEVRCAANAALALAIMQGPQATIRFATRVAGRAEGIQLGPASGPNFASNATAALSGISATVAADFIREGWGTYAHLSEIADATKLVMSRNRLGFSTGIEAGAMAALAGTTRRIDRLVRSRVEFVDTWLARLEPGDGYIVNVDTDVLAHGTAPSIAQGNHYVTVGRSADGEDYWLYDPYPRTGDQFILSTNSEFWTIFENAEGDWKEAYIESRTSPPR